MVLQLLLHRDFHYLPDWKNSQCFKGESTSVLLMIPFFHIHNGEGVNLVFAKFLLSWKWMAVERRKAVFLSGIAIKSTLIFFFAWNLCEYDIKLFKNVASTKSLVYYKLVST